MNLSFIKLDINILDDTKIKLIRKYPDGDKLFILWVGLLCLAMKSDKPGYIYVTNGIPYTDNDLSILFEIDLKTVQLGLSLFKQYNMIDFLNGGIIEIINFNKHQNLDKIEKARQISRESSKKYRERQKDLLLSDGHVMQSDETDKDKNKDKDKDIDEIYNKYPSKDKTNNNRSTSKSEKDKDKIRSLLKKKTKDDIINVIDFYLKECYRTNTFLKNFSTFLNNLPDIKKSDQETVKPAENNVTENKPEWKEWGEL